MAVPAGSPGPGAAPGPQGVVHSGCLRPSPLPPTRHTAPAFAFSQLHWPLNRLRSRCSDLWLPGAASGGEGLVGLGVGVLGRMRRCDPHCPPPAGGCPNTPKPPGRSQKGRAAALVLLCFWGSQTQTVVPVVSERRLLGAEGDKPGLSSRTRRAWLSLSQVLGGPGHPPRLLTCKGCNL